MKTNLKHNAAAGFILLSLLVPTCALAQHDTATLPSVEVHGQQSEGYAAQSVSIGRREQTLREIPQSVSVITRQRLDDQNLHSLEQVMTQTTGVTVQAAPAGMLYDFYSRGFLIENVSFDNVQTLPGWGGFDVMPDTATIERIEVLRGADGLYSGAGQPGGTVNLVRKKPLAQHQTQASFALGSWDNKRAELDISQPLNHSGTLRARGVLAWQDKDFFFDSPHLEKRVAYGVLETDLGVHTTASLGLNYQKMDSPMETGHPRAVDGRDLGLSRRRSFTAPWSFYNFESTHVFADLHHAFNTNWKLQANAFVLRENSVFKDAYIRGSYDPVTQNGLIIYGNASRLQSRQHGLDLTLDGSFDLLSRRHGISVGASYIERDSPFFAKEGWNFPEINTPVGLDFDPHLIPEPAMPSRIYKERNENTRQTGTYAVLRWSLTDPLTLITGARATWYDYGNKNLLTGAFNNRYKQNGEITPYAGVVWDFATHYSLYASYTDIFRVQSNLHQADGTPLDPALGANYEIGIKASTPNERLNASLAVFRIDETNRSQSDPAWPSGINGRTVYINAGEVRSEGIEAEINGEVLRGWQWSAGYTYNTTEYLRDRTATGTPSNNEGKSFRSYTPKHMLRVYTTYTLPGTLERWSVSGGMNTQSEIYNSNATVRAKQSGYAVFNAGIGYTANAKLSLRLAMNNLSDKVYYRRINTREGNLYGEPRSFMLTARVKL